MYPRGQGRGHSRRCGRSTAKGERDALLRLHPLAVERNLMEPREVMRIADVLAGMVLAARFGRGLKDLDVDPTAAGANLGLARAAPALGVTQMHGGKESAPPDAAYAMRRGSPAW